MKLPKLRNAMSVIIFMKTGKNWKTNLLKILDAQIAMIKKAPAIDWDCVRPTMQIVRGVIWKKRRVRSCVVNAT
jgi:hypothetical protein